MRSTAEVLAHHFKCFAGRDLNGILADYSADALFFSPEGVLRGPEAIRGIFEKLFHEFQARLVHFMENETRRRSVRVQGLYRGDARQLLRTSKRRLRRSKWKHPNAGFHRDGSQEIRYLTKAPHLFSAANPEQSTGISSFG